MGTSKICPPKHSFLRKNSIRYLTKKSHISSHGFHCFKINGTSGIHNLDITNYTWSHLAELHCSRYAALRRSKNSSPTENFPFSTLAQFKKLVCAFSSPQGSTQIMTLWNFHGGGVECGKILRSFLNLDRNDLPPPTLISSSIEQFL